MVKGSTMVLCAKQKQRYVKRKVINISLVSDETKDLSLISSGFNISLFLFEIKTRICWSQMRRKQGYVEARWDQGEIPLNIRVGRLTWGGWLKHNIRSSSNNIMIRSLVSLLQESPVSIPYPLYLDTKIKLPNYNGTLDGDILDLWIWILQPFFHSRPDMI